MVTMLAKSYRAGALRLDGTPAEDITAYVDRVRRHARGAVFNDIGVEVDTRGTHCRHASASCGEVLRRGGPLGNEQQADCRRAVLRASEHVNQLGRGPGHRQPDAERAD